MLEESPFSFDKLNVLFLGVGFLTLNLLGIQLWLALANYYPGANFALLALITALGIIMAMIKGKIVVNIPKVPLTLKVLTIGLLLLVTYFIGREQPGFFIFWSLVIVAVIFHLAYKLAVIGERFRIDKEKLTKVKKNYQRNLEGFIHLKLTIVKIVLLIIAAWLFNQEISPGLMILGMTTFFLQFVLLAIGFYLRKKVNWQLENRRWESNLFIRMVSIIVIISLFFSIVAVILPVHLGSLVRGVGERVGAFIEGIDRGPMELEPPPAMEEGREAVDESRPEVEDGEMPWYVRLLTGITMLFIGFFTLAFIVFLLTIIWEAVVRQELKTLKKLPYFIKMFFGQMVKLVKSWFGLIGENVKEVRQKWMSASNSSDTKKEDTADDVIEESGFNLNPEIPREKIILLFLQLRDLFSEKGFSRQENETLIEYLKKIEDEYSNYRSQLFILQQLIIEALYSNHDLSWAEAEEMEVVVKELEEAF